MNRVPTPNGTGITPVRMLFTLALLIGAPLAFILIVAALKNQLAEVAPVVSVLAASVTGIAGGITLFIKLSEPRDKP